MVKVITVPEDRDITAALDYAVVTGRTDFTLDPWQHGLEGSLFRRLNKALDGRREAIWRYRGRFFLCDRVGSRRSRFSADQGAPPSYRIRTFGSLELWRSGGDDGVERERS